MEQQTNIHTRLGTLLAAAITATMIFVLSGTVSGGIISEGFPSEGNYPSGTVVSIRNTVPTTIELASTQNSDYLVGVVETYGDSLLSVSDDQSTLSVATIGEVEVFVSDVNGDIEIGDFIGASWIKGVGMKADDDTQQKVLGIAIEEFKGDDASSLVFEDLDTPKGSVANFGKIAIRLFDKEVGPDVNEAESALENFASRIAGKDVTFVRVVAAAGLFVVATLISGIFLANAIRGSFISIGRNPLSSSSVFASLMQVSGVSISLLLIGAVLAYIVLIV